MCVVCVFLYVKIDGQRVQRLPARLYLPKTSLALSRCPVYVQSECAYVVRPAYLSVYLSICLAWCYCESIFKKLEMSASVLKKPSLLMTASLCCSACMNSLISRVFEDAWEMPSCP